MPWSRASELSRAVACPASTHLPRAPRESSGAAEWGTVVHAWAETGRWDPDNLATRRRAAALVGAGVTREALWPGPGEHEVSFALHTRNRVCARERHPDRAARDTWCSGFDSEWLTGTADWVGEWFGEPWIEDLKTGVGHPVDYAGHNDGTVAPDGGDPWDLWQLRFYAAAELLWRPDAAGVWVSVLWWPRYPADSVPLRIGPRRVDRAEVTGLTVPLLETARVAREASLDSVDARPGEEQCRWCPSKGHCPAWQRTNENQESD